MPRATQKARDQFYSHILDHAPMCQLDKGERRIDTMETLKLCSRLMRFGATYARIQEMYCNDPMNQGTQDYWERREKNIEKHVAKIADRLGCKPVFSGDPRGHTVKIACPDGYADDWGKEGICVPTS